MENMDLLMEQKHEHWPDLMPFAMDSATNANCVKMTLKNCVYAITIRVYCFLNYWVDPTVLNQVRPS